MDIEAISALKQAQVAQQFGVKVLVSAGEQAKAVAAELLSSITQVPAPESGKGQRLNITA